MPSKPLIIPHLSGVMDLSTSDTLVHAPYLSGALPSPMDSSTSNSFKAIECPSSSRSAAIADGLDHLQCLQIHCMSLVSSQLHSYLLPHNLCPGQQQQVKQKQQSLVTSTTPLPMPSNPLYIPCPVAATSTQSPSLQTASQQQHSCSQPSSHHIIFHLTTWAFSAIHHT